MMSDPCDFPTLLDICQEFDRALHSHTRDGLKTGRNNWWNQLSWITFIMSFRNLLQRFLVSAFLVSRLTAWTPSVFLMHWSTTAVSLDVELRAALFVDIERFISNYDSSSWDYLAVQSVYRVYHSYAEYTSWYNRRPDCEFLVLFCPCELPWLDQCDNQYSVVWMSG